MAKEKTVVRYRNNPNNPEKKKRRSNRSWQNRFTIPMAVVAGLAAPSIKIWEARVGGASGMVREAGRILTGFDFWNGQWVPGAMRYGLLPLLGGIAVHMVVGKWLGLNGLLRRSGLPIIRV